MLRTKLSLLATVFPYIIVGLASWLYSVPRATITLNNDFLLYKDPHAATIVIGLILLSLFLPVGFYFLRSGLRQHQLRGTLISLVMGLVYIAVGILTGGVELFYGEVVTHTTAILAMVFFSVQFIVLVWPRHLHAPFGQGDKE